MRSAPLSDEQRTILEQRGVLSPAQIHALANKTRGAVGAEEGKASCHSDLTDADAAQKLQEQRLVKLGRKPRATP